MECTGVSSKEQIKSVDGCWPPLVQISAPACSGLLWKQGYVSTLASGRQQRSQQ